MTMNISTHIERNKEYVRIVEGSEYAVLFVHGIIGTPRHFDFLMDLVPSNDTLRRYEDSQAFNALLLS